MSIDAGMLQRYGWGPFFQEAWQARKEEAGQEPGRLIAEYRGGYVLATSHGDLKASAAGRLRLAIRKGESERPAVGDWVSLEARPQEGSAVIHAVLPRRTQLVRKAAGRGEEEQVVAANVDVVFLVSALTRDLNPRRLERYLALAWDSKAQPVVVLTKADLSEDVAAARERIATLAPGVALHTVSSFTGEGVDALLPYLQDRQTVAFIGSSGVGKSTLINRLLGTERQEVGAVREDDKGRHTTTHRELLVTPQGGLVIDTPGMRELGLWEAEEGVQATFTDIEALATGCRFNDCRHQNEPGCAVQEAARTGALAPERMESYRKLVQEVAFQDRQRDTQAQSRHKQETKQATRALNSFQKKRGR
jgi:ribosome biogenesis GTPase